MYFLSNGKGTPIITYFYCSVFVHFDFRTRFQEELYETRGLSVLSFGYVEQHMFQMMR